MSITYCIQLRIGLLKMIGSLSKALGILLAYEVRWSLKYQFILNEKMRR